MEWKDFVMNELFGNLNLHRYDFKGLRLILPFIIF